MPAPGTGTASHWCCEPPPAGRGAGNAQRWARSSCGHGEPSSHSSPSRTLGTSPTFPPGASFPWGIWLRLSNLCDPADYPSQFTQITHPSAGLIPAERGSGRRSQPLAPRRLTTGQRGAQPSPPGTSRAPRARRGATSSPPRATTAAGEPCPAPCDPHQPPTPCPTPPRHTARAAGLRPRDPSTPPPAATTLTSLHGEEEEEEGSGRGAPAVGGSGPCARQPPHGFARASAGGAGARCPPGLM